MRAMPAVTALLATTASQTVLRQARLGVFQGFAYSPYGWRLSSVDTAAGFNGQCLEPATGGYLLGNGHRLYNPVLMRFTRPDALSPFGKGGVNAYAYCEGDPVNASDPSGEFFQALLALTRLGGGGSGLSFTSLVAIKNPAADIALGGLRIAVVGGLVGTAGATMAVAGDENAAIVASVGAGIAGIGTVMRAVPVARAIRAAPHRGQLVGDGVRRFFGVKPKPTPAHRNPALSNSDRLRAIRGQESAWQESQV
jgi:RHS repeat-associated protein